MPPSLLISCRGPRIIEIGDYLGCKNIEKHGKWAVLKNYIHDKGKGAERAPFIFVFRLNIVLHDSYQVDEIVMEIEEWKEKVPGNSVKSFRRVLFSLLETSIVS